MSSLTLPQLTKKPNATPHIALAGQPNAGKTTLFNRLTGLRAKTANFPGTTVEVRTGKATVGGRSVEVMDLPGLYGLDGESPDQAAAHAAIAGVAPGVPRPDVLVVVLDATRLPHHLPLAGELRSQGVPVVVAVNMIDEAQRQRIAIDFDGLSEELGAPIVPVSARRGTGIDALLDRVDGLLTGRFADADVPAELEACGTCGTCPVTARCRWADQVSDRVSPALTEAGQRRSDTADAWLTHPVAGLLLFTLVMAALFIGVFRVASTPMDWVDGAFGWLGETAAGVIPDAWLGGLFESFIVDGVIAGVGGVVIFLPQICILFFGIALLEDSGYLSRAVVVMDRLLRRVGLPGQAFVPMLSAHACAIPAIMSTRLIDNARDRLRAILVIPLLTCSARLPVYAMVAALLFAGQPLYGGLLFFAGYFLGGIAAIAVAFLLGKSVLPGAPSRLAVELPPYRLPSLKVAALITLDRGLVFLKQAGTIILVISLVLWAALTFPQLPEDRLTQVATPTHVAQLEQIDAALADASIDPDRAEGLQADRDHLYAQYASEYSAAGRVGKAIEPVFEPLGFDWRISVGVLSSFAAREVVVSSMAVIAGVGDEAGEDDPSFLAALESMRRPDGSKLFTVPTALSLMVFFVLAMQCLPTQAVTKRETGSWKWPLVQLGYMTALAYGAAFVTYQVASALV